MLGVLTASELNVAPTWSSSFLLLMIPNVENLSSAANDAFSRTVRPAAKPSVCLSEGHEGRLLQKLSGLQRTPLKIYGPFGWLKPGKRPHQFRLAVAFHSGHADDLPPRHLERYVMKSSAAQRLHRKDHLF